MPGVKEAGKSQASAAAAAAAAATDVRIAGKNAKMEAGQVLITEAARHAAEMKEELLKESSARKEEDKEDRDRTEEKKDTSELSRQSKWFGIEGKFLKDADIKWTLEMLKEQWEAFQNWMPAADKELSAHLEELSKLYLALLEAVLTHTAGEEQLLQIERLNEILAQKLNLLMDLDLKDLMKLLEQTGKAEELDRIRSSVYKQTTGESISARAAGRFFARGNVNSTGNTRYFMPGSQGQQAVSGRGGKGMYTAAASSASAGSLSAASEEGRFYELAKGRNIRMNQALDIRGQSGELQMSQRARALNGAKGSGGADMGIPGGKTLPGGKELAGANRFAAHMNGSGNLLASPDISARNEEVLGLLAAVTSIKSQVYASNLGRNNAMSTPLRSAINQMIDYYLTQKGAYKVYGYTANIYEKTKSPQKAIEEGLEYAYRIFMEKKGDAVYQQQEAYSEKAGFFQMLLKGQSLQADLIRGMKLLEGNWREFLKAVGENEKKGITLKMQKHSPWGILFEAQGFEKGKREQKGKSVLLTEIAGIAVLIVIYLCFRLFF